MAYTEVLYNDAEGGTVGNAVATAGAQATGSGTLYDVWTAATGGVVTYSSGAIEGTKCYAITGNTAGTYAVAWTSAFAGGSFSDPAGYAFIKFDNLPTANAILFKVFNDTTFTTSAFQIAVSSTGGVIIYGGSGLTNLGTTATTLSPSTWYRTEWYQDPISTKFYLKVYTGLSTSAPIINVTYTNANLTQAMKSFRWNLNSVGWNKLYIDKVSVGYGGLPTVPANASPLVSVTTPVTVAAGGSAALVSTESDPDGDTITGTWAWLSGPANVAPAAPSSASTSVTLATPGRYVYRRTVTDGISTPTFADAVVRVTTTPVRPDALISNAGGFTVTGAASIPAAEADESDASYSESPNSAVNAVKVESLAPMTTPTDKSGITLKVRSRRNGGTTGTIKLELMEGATVRKDFGTQTLTGSFADYTLALDLTSANAIVDWSNLSVRQTDNVS